jgi:hypothetical protein
MLRFTISGLRNAFALISAILALFGATVMVSAQQQPVMLGIQPVGVTGSYFSLTLAPGETRELTVELANFGTVKVRARTYAADAYTIINGGFGARLDGEPTSGTTRWLDYPVDTLELAPRAGVQRMFKVSVPADTKPGEYITSLVIQSAESQPTGSTGVAIRQVLRQAVAVAVSVPGPHTPGLVIGAATYRTIAGTSMVAVVVKNTGNVHLKPSGEFVLHDAKGTEISRYPIAMDTVYAGTSTFIEVPFNGRLNPGKYTVALTLTDSKQQAPASVQAAPLIVPSLETEGVPAPIGVVPPPAPINQLPIAFAGQGLQLYQILIGGCLIIVIALVGFYIYRRKRRTQTRTVA